MKRALITGAAGFLGRHFHHRLLLDGWKVSAIDIVRSDDLIVRQVNALEYFRHTADDGPFDLVLHCAAVVGGRDVTDNSPLSQAVNLELDAAMFRWALRAKPGRIVYFSSSAVYPVQIQTFACRMQLDESMAGLSRAEPDALYGWAKLTGERLAYLARQQGVPVTIVRPFSGYGEDQDTSYPFPAFIRRARASADPFPVWGDPRQVRDFIHVDDIVEGTLAIAESGTALPVNLGWGDAVALGDLALLVCHEAGYSPAVTGDPSAPMGVEYRVADVSRMRMFFEPKVTLEEGIRRAVRSCT